MIKRILPLLALAFVVSCSESEPAQEAENTPVIEREVNVYTKRHYDSDKELFTRFTEETGIKVNVIQSESSGSLMERMIQEGENSPCDVYITSDAGNLGMAKEKGLLQAVSSETLSAAIPEQYRDSDGEWFGLSIRARIIAYNKEAVEDPSIVSTYGDLAKEEFKGKVLVRSSSNIYNQSLLAAMIAHEGDEAAKEWAKGIVNNMARDPKGGDTDQLKAVAAGQGDFAIANSYYLARLMASDEEEKKAVAEKLGVIFPKLADGTHVNISGAGVAKHAPNKEEAVALLEFMVSDEAQRVFAEGNHEYPVKAGIPASSVISAWGEFDRDQLPLNMLHTYNANAARVFDEAGWK